MNKKPSILGSRIRQARERAKRSVSHVARLVEKGEACVYRWEWGQTEPSFADLTKMAEDFGLTVGQLVDGVAEEIPDLSA